MEHSLRCATSSARLKLIAHHYDPSHRSVSVLSELCGDSYNSKSKTVSSTFEIERDEDIPFNEIALAASAITLCFRRSSFLAQQM